MAGSTQPTVVFVASLPHSGSTLLDLVVSTHPEAVGVGELRPVRDAVVAGRRLDDRRCTCGATATDCDLWGPVLARLGSTTTASELAAAVVDVAHHRLGRRIIVDSSKQAPQLQAVASLPVDLRVVHLTRDVRSWAAAMRRTGRAPALRAPRHRADLAALRAALSFRARRTSFGLFRWWYLRNRALEATLRAVGAPTIRLSYEELATATPGALRRLATDLGLDPVLSTDTTAACTHQLFGSTMRFDPVLRGAVVYDTRWMTDDRLLLPALLLRPVMAYNRRLVHAGAVELPWGRGRPDQPR